MHIPTNNEPLSNERSRILKCCQGTGVDCANTKQSKKEIFDFSICGSLIKRTIRITNKKLMIKAGIIGIKADWPTNPLSV